MFAARKTPFERRLKELDREARQVRSDLKALHRALEKPERLASAPRPRSLQKRPAAVTPPQREDPVRQADKAADEAAEAAAAPPPGELFAWRPPVPVREKKRKAEEPPPAPAAPADPARKGARFLKDERFTNYFASGSFVGSPPAKGEGRVQRNKAVFMILIVIVVGFILYRLVF
ncbi:MAG: hypothetical protein KA248_15420 [Kiritimatiellae bacterium]|nr:hypothetical protein [Kiritimatiellia bacterium]